MEQNSTMYTLGTKKIFAAFAILSSLLGIIFLIATLMQKPPLPNQVASYFEASRGSFILFATLSLVWSITTVPTLFAIGLVSKKSSNNGLSYTAIALTSAGILLNGIVSFIYVGALLSIGNSSTIQGANSNYEMSIWTNLFYFMTDPALMIWGLGQFFLGIILFSNIRYPKCLGIITMVGGLAGLLTLVVYQTPVLAILQEVTLIILTSYFSVYLLRENKD